MSYLEQNDAAIFDLIRQEEIRQKDKIRLIASENYVSAAVMEATGSVLTNKYSEGYPGKRYYEGQQYIDQVESLAIQRAKELFGAEHVNVQPYSGSPANLAVYLAFLQPGDTILGMALPHGGHLTHGAKVSISGKYFRAEAYSLDPATGLLNYDAIREQALPAGRRSSLPATPPTRASSTSPGSARLPMYAALCCWSTWPTSPDWWRAAPTPRPSPTPTWSPPPPTSRCADRAGR